jgi:hypothetical protein
MKETARTGGGGTCMTPRYIQQRGESFDGKYFLLKVL